MYVNYLIYILFVYIIINIYIRSNREQIKSMLQTNMGFGSNYIERAFRVYEKNYGNNYNVY